jgi:hypothetical protein
MPIIFGSDVGIRNDTYHSFVDQISQDFSRVARGLRDAFTSLTGTISYLKDQPPLENVYVDDGFNNVPGNAFVGSQISNIDDIKTRQIITQEPQLTLYIKKRAFWSLRGENDTKFLDSGEKLFLRATKILFERKCSQIAAYEAITKAGRLLSEDAQIDADRLKAVAEYLESALGSIDASLEADALAAINTDPSNIQFSEQIMQQLDDIRNQFDEIAKAIAGLQKLEKDQRKLNSATTTNWVVDPDVSDICGVGRGSGVIELTCVTDLNTSLGIEAAELGSVSFTIEDPYNLCKIASEDLEVAIGVATAEIDSGFTREAPSLLLEAARNKDADLQRIRSQRMNTSGILGAFTSVSDVSLNATNKYDIVFEINASVQSEYQAVAYISNYPEPVNQDNYNIVFNSLPPEARLTSAEANLVADIFDLLTRYATAIVEQNNSIMVDNERKDVEYARQTLRVHYLGKSIVQPMDGVHVYIRSNTAANSDVVGPVSALLNGAGFIRAFRDDQAATNAMLEEEMTQFGIKDLNIPVDLYRQLRTGSLMRNAGTHVFGGLISKVTESYQADRGYTLSVFGESNKKWLSMSRTNNSPSLDQTQGVLEDPLTPLEIEVDPGTGLIVSEPAYLQENIRRMDQNSKSPLRFTSGSYIGELVDPNSLAQDVHSTGAKVIQHAPGLTYRWKRGIITATRNVNLRTSLDGRGVSSDRLRREVGVNIVENPFGSMDAADIVSTLVTGYPHSYETFLAHTIGTYTHGGGTNSPDGFFNTMLDLLKTNNRAFGGFQPFKTSNLTPDKMAERIKTQVDITTSSAEISSLSSQIAVLNDEIAALTPASTSNAPSESDGLRAQILDGKQTELGALQSKMNRALATFREKVSASESVGLRVYGSDVNVVVEAAETPEETNANIARRRVKNEILQMRSQLNCKFNRDANLFIVSDDYDKDLDIQAFVQKLNNSIDMWKSEFKDPLTTCALVANTLDMEFVCDSQGHIQFRPPKYNKVPLSLVLKMMMLRQKDGKRLYPEFLDSLFKTQYTSLQNELDAVNKQLEIQATLLGYSDKVGRVMAGVDIALDESTKLLKVSAFESINTNANTTDVTALVQKRNELVAIIGGNPIEPTDANLAAAAKELVALNDSTQPNMNAARNSEVAKMGQLISRKQRLVDAMTKIENKNTDDPTKIRGTSTIPQSNEEQQRLLGVFGDLIEDDYNDLLGPGSSQRYVITDDKILRSDFTESDQNVFCRIDVTGGLDLMSSDGTLGGMPYMWAGATDFDLWRQYGWKPANEVNKPFLKDPVLQCAPYAQMLLTRARKNAVTGTVTVIGNEYYQVGDVVYLNSRDMLYYVTQVQQAFSYSSGNFATTLELRMGHPLGEYIPTPMDVIGKMLIKNQNGFNNLVTYRQTAHKKNTHIGTVVFDSKSTETDLLTLFEEMLTSSNGAVNLVQLKNALLQINQSLERPSVTQDHPKVDVRGYSNGKASSDVILARVEAVRTWLSVAPSIIEGEEAITLSPSEFPPMPAERLVPVSSELDPVDLTLKSEDLPPGNKNRQPSQTARSFDTDISSCIDIILVL